MGQTDAPGVQQEHDDCTAHIVSSGIRMVLVEKSYQNWDDRPVWVDELQTKRPSALVTRDRKESRTNTGILGLL